MSSQLTTTLNCLPSLQRIERKPLCVCLGLIGATPVRTRYESGWTINQAKRHAHKGGGFNLGRLTEWELHDLYIECHKLWLEGCKMIQTHLVKNHEAAAKWNALWARLEELFKRRGVTA
ncbi:MAG: hypothetical protein WAO21_04745 [Verrucomicrobiia bacterium]|jgi:hypothetical protein